MVDQAINDRLRAGERLVWTGRPAQGLLFYLIDIIALPITLLWSGSAIWWEFSVVAETHWGRGAMFGFPFFLLGALFLSTAFLIDPWIRQRERYAITDQRVLILRPIPFWTFTTLDFSGSFATRLNPRWNGRGTILLGPRAHYFGADDGGKLFGPLWFIPCFLAIPDARGVFELLQQTIDAAGANTI